MPSKKQRRRRAKSIRHDYEYVYVDDEGNEVEVEPDDGATSSKAQSKRAEPATATESKSKIPAAKRSGRTTARSMREVKPPSWRKVGKRALIFAPVMFFAVSLIDRGRQGYVFYLGQTVFLLAFFLPFSYVMDSITYRMYLKRSGRAPARDEKKPQAPSRSPR